MTAFHAPLLGKLKCEGVNKRQLNNISFFDSLKLVRNGFGSERRNWIGKLDDWPT
jgi:hypothetical protein